MTAILEIRAEIVKLARLLEVEPAELDYLEGMPAEALAEFRRQLVDRFYGGEDGGLQRFAKVGNLLPASAIAALTKEAVGPVLAARIAGMVDPKQAVAVTAKLPVKFVADITVQLDPRRVGPVIGGMPSATSGKIARELIRRGEHVAIGQFLGYMEREGLKASIAEMTDADLLKIAFVAEDKSRLPDAVELMSDERLKGTMKIAGREKLWSEALDLLQHMDDTQYFRIIEVASKLDAKTLDELMRATEADDLWPIVIPAIAQMADPSAAVAALLRADGAAIKAFADAVIGDQAWTDARELLEKLSEMQRTDLHRRLARNGRAERFKPVADVFAA